MQKVCARDTIYLYNIGPCARSGCSKSHVFYRLPVVSYPWIFRIQTIRTQAQAFRTHFRPVRTQPSGRFVPNKL